MPRPLALDDAAGRVLTNRGRAPQSVGYVYFHNTAERGISLCRPLAAATTEKGDIYFNSRGEVFVEARGALAAELGTAPRSETPLSESAVTQQVPSSQAKRLLQVGRW
jgi:hypothetical protein